MWLNLKEIDTLLFLTINRSFSHGFLDRFFLIATEPIYYVIPALLVFLYFLKIDWKRTMVVVMLAAITLGITDTLCDEALKPLFSRLRPCHPEKGVEGAICVAGSKTSYSFPSAHAMNIFAQATLFAFLYPAKSAYFFIFALMIGLSRIYIGVHFPADVVGGAIGGSVLAMGVYAPYAIVKKYRRPSAA